METATKRKIELRERFQDVGNFLKIKREKAHFSQGLLAQTLGYSSPQYVSNWERGLCSPPFEMLPKICHVLKISKSEIINVILDQTERELNRNFARYKRR